MAAMPLAKMVRASLAFILSLTCLGSQVASAATITNSGKKAVVVQVADTSGRIDMTIDPGSSEDFCPAGCFVTLPNGDRLGLGGGESVDLHDGAASVK